MPRRSQRLSLANVRTHTTRRTSPALAKHEMYMKLTSLEIERSRRSTERKATMDRVEMIDQRLREIETEQAEIRRLLDEQKTPLEQNKQSNKGFDGLNLSY